MEAAELTRGAFYAHFASKEELFTIVVGCVPPLLEKLRDRGDRHTHHLVDGAVEILREAFSMAGPDADEQGHVGALDTLAADVARADVATQLTYAMRLGEVADELMRGFEREEEHDPRALVVLSLLVGGWTIARACGPDALAEQVLVACADAAERILRGE
jgi:TetR/AcrR family transcriptional repressor of nem operon